MLCCIDTANQPVYLFRRAIDRTDYPPRIVEREMVPPTHGSGMVCIFREYRNGKCDKEVGPVNSKQPMPTNAQADSSHHGLRYQPISPTERYPTHTQKCGMIHRRRLVATGLHERARPSEEGLAAGGGAVRRLRSAALDVRHHLGREQLHAALRDLQRHPTKLEGADELRGVHRLGDGT